MELKIITTTYLNGLVETVVKDAVFIEDKDGIENRLINVYPEVEYQSFSGFGGAFTEAAGYTLSRMSEKVYDDVINEYFGIEGLNYSYCRTHIDSCDFSLGNYSAVIDENDYELKTFSLERDEKFIIPMIKRAQQVSKEELKLMLSPWSPPAFMKSNGQKNEGGKLKPEYHSMWAKYISRYIQEYRRKGINVVAVSPQNEPKAVQKWDSCIYSAEEEGMFISEFLSRQLEADGLGDIEIIIWDHNKERAYERTKNTLSVGNCMEAVSGIGFHWYSGDHFEALEIIRRMYPEKSLIFTEGCVEYSRFNSDNQLKNAQMYAHDIIGNLNNGMNAFIDWNMVLDEKGGPNHVGNFCDAPIMCDTQKDSYEKRLSFIYIGHFSKYIKPQAIRVAYSKFTDKIEVTVFKNKDKRMVAIVLNRSTENISYILRVNDMVCNIQSEPSSITTLLF